MDAICGEDCQNAQMFIECVGQDPTVKQKNPYVNCNCASEADCGNRKMTKRAYARTQPRRENGMGWGLVTLDGVNAGDLVVEYTGEVLNGEMVDERMRVREIEHGNDPNFYVMDLGAGWFVDAREKGNLARFINHSCDGNCVTQKINVAGYNRIAIVAVRDVEPGDFLSYDYQFDISDKNK